MAINTSALRRIAGPLVDYFNEQFEALKAEMRTQSELQASHFSQAQQASDDRLTGLIVDRDNERDNERLAQMTGLETKIYDLSVAVEALGTEIADLQHEILQLQTVTQQLLAVGAASMSTTPS